MSPEENGVLFFISCCPTKQAASFDGKALLKLYFFSLAEKKFVAKIQKPEYSTRY
ncbi:MAG: hypothetical protein JW902_02375 [Syntrophaceae bacterium]|nr:hypothetical protein [Syntrophaceae bacterium]